MTKKKHLFDSKPAKTLWNKADDAIRRGVMLCEIYSKVPEKIRCVRVSVLELHVIEADIKTKKEVLKWLNE